MSHSASLSSLQHGKTKGSVVDRRRIHNRLSGLEQAEQRRDDRRHAGVEDQSSLRAALQGHELRLQNLSVGMIEPGID